MRATFVAVAVVGLLAAQGCTTDDPVGTSSAATGSGGQGGSGGSDQGGSDQGGSGGSDQGGSGGISDGGGGADGGMGGSGPACDDGVQNGDETDVDCGGSCAPCDQGGACLVDDDCASDSCADGVCCDSACDALCEACVAAKTGGEDGVCAAVLADTDPDDECEASDPSTCGNSGSCNGDSSAPACMLHPAGVQCADATCDAGSSIAASTCDGLGACVAPAPVSCGAYACDEMQGACYDSCISAAECASGNGCYNGSCGCPVLTAVSTATLITQMGSTQGVWMEDPLETLGFGLIWRINHYAQPTIQRFANVAALQANTPEDTWSLPTAQNGTGAVVYDGHLYYNPDNTPNMAKYDLANKQLVTTVPLPAGTGFHNTYHYQWGGYSDIDFAVDENGLWVIYATSQSGGNIVISKLDTDLNITQSWTTSVTKNTGQSFMICGRLYTVASYSQANTTINHVYDTATSSGQSIAIPFTNPGGYNSMVDYNPNTKLLYSWDSTRHQTYSLTF